MAGATLSSSLPSRFAVKLENGDTTGLDIATNIREGKLTVDDGGVLSCPYCSFTTTSLSELKSHRWEVHPLLAKRKGHLMCMSPKNSRKRPNSESSEDGKLTDPDEGAPKKKASPRHSPLVSDEATSRFRGAIVRANRSSSADDIMVLNSNSKALIPEKQTGIVDYTPSNLAIQSKSPSSFGVNNFKFLSPPITDKFDYSSRRSASESPNSDSGCVPSPPSPTAYDETCDLHTLAKAALNASPMPQPHPVNFYENKSLLVPPSVGYHLHPYSYVVGSNFGSSYPIPYMNNFYYHGYHPNEERVAFDKSLTSKTMKEASPTTCFPHQAPFTSNRITAPAMPTHISSNFISSANTRANPALYHPSSLPGSQTTLSTPVHSDKNRLSALSQVATDRLSPSAPVGSKDNEVSPKLFSYYQPENMEVLNQRKKSVIPSESASLRENLRKSHVHQRQQETKSMMDDDRVRLLEEALSKIDCCDPQERSNVLPYRCPDGKWRMVQAKCVGGAWLIQVPGAPHPSVYVPYQKKSSSYETLDDWLKARLTSTDRSYQHKSDPKPPNSPPIKQYSQVGRQFFAAMNSKRPSGFFNSVANQPVQSGAIKSLLLQKSTLS